MILTTQLLKVPLPMAKRRSLETPELPILCWKSSPAEPLPEVILTVIFMIKKSIIFIIIIVKNIITFELRMVEMGEKILERIIKSGIINPTGRKTD